MTSKYQTLVRDPVREYKDFNSYEKRNIIETPIKTWTSIPIRMHESKKMEFYDTTRDSPISIKFTVMEKKPVQLEFSSSLNDYTEVFTISNVLTTYDIQAKESRYLLTVYQDEKNIFFKLNFIKTVFFS